MQDWWDHATESMRGLRPDDAERTRFLVRQTLDVLSPSNAPLRSPEIVAETGKTRGRSLTDGAAHFARDALKTLTGQRNLSLEKCRRRGVVAALDVVSTIVPDTPVQAVDYCLGGSVLRLRRRRWRGMAMTGSPRSR